MEVKEAINYILDGEAVLFVGAGFSCEAINIHDEKMKDAQKLSSDLCSEMGIENSSDLGAVSDYYLGDQRDVEYSRRAQRLIRKLQDSFTCKQVSEAQGIISKNKWIRVYTTNYDDVVEMACDGNPEYERTPMTMKDTLENITRTDCVVHLNGYIRNLDITRLENEFKLTTRSYLVDDFCNSEISGLFYKDLREARAVVFIGTSLKYDLDIQRILYSLDENSSKIIFIEKKKEEKKIDVIEDRKKEILGTVHYIGMDEFAKELAETAKVYVPNSQELIFRSFERINQKDYPYDRGRVTSTWNLFANGDLRREVLFSHLEDDNYLVRRSVAKEIEDNIDNYDKTINIIHANLGNGKTCLMEYLMCHLSKKHRVFNFCQQYNDIDKEMKSIKKMDGKKIIFIEDYNLYINMIKNIRYYWDETWHLVLSCRTYINITSIYKLSRALEVSIDQISEFDINRFSDEEKPKIISSIKEVNQADLKDLGMSKAMKMLSKNGQNCWADTVMYLFNSQFIGKKIEKAYDKVKSNQNNMEIIIAAMINNIVGLNLSYDQLLTITKISQRNLDLSRNENAAEILSVQDGKVEIKSSLLSLYLIRTKRLYSAVIQVMKKMILNSNLLMGDDANTVKRMLISTSNISELFYKELPHFNDNLSNRELHKEILDYFSDICKVTYYERNEFFWLQYAMACMDIGDYSLAENNFKLAHRYEKEKNVESYQIKVQYGRFLLEKANEYKDEQSPIKIFSKVNKEWQTALMHSESQKYFVYKQMEAYLQFIETYAPSFSASDYNKATRMIDNMINTINKYDKGETKDSSKSEAIGRLKKCKKILIESIIPS